MTRLQKTYVLGGLLICGFGMPRISYAVTGCTSANLIGMYNAQISSQSLVNLLNAINGSAGGATSSTGTSSSPVPSGTTTGGLFGGNTGFGDMGATTGGAS